MSDQNIVTPAAADVAVMDQLPGAEIQGQSPLHHVDLGSLAQHGPKQGGVHLRERSLLGLINLRCNADSEAHRAAVEKVLGIPLPLQPLSSAATGQYSICWISPDEWLIIVPGEETFSIESKLRKEMDGHYSVVNSSGGSTVLELSGANVVDLLKKCTPIDLHLREFPVGKVVSSVFAKSTAIIRRIDEQRFELVIRRSFADYIWLWLQDASREFGLVIEK